MSVFRDLLNRLTSKSIDDYYNPYQLFNWPDVLPENMWWMSPELMTTFDTGVAEELSTEQLYTLSRHESVNFYSLNVHGIRELLIEVTRRIHTPAFAIPSEFFHHFIGEENEHMWFFAEFCRRYGKKIYKQPKGGAEVVPPDGAENLLVFVRILIFEELVDHFNSKMATDDRLHETIREINRIHHQDESRHIAFGRELVRTLFEDFRATASEAELAEVRGYLARYLVFSFESLYNPQVYRDAGLSEPFDIRRRLRLSFVAGPLKPVEGLVPEDGHFSPSQTKAFDLGLPTATCFGAYLFFEGREVAPTELVTLVNRCFRAEDHVEGLRRLLSFQMREIVALGSYDHTQEVLIRFTDRIEQFLSALGLSRARKAASDPFFQGEGGRALLQKLEAVKHEFVMDDLAIASVNTHRNFFGERCRITIDADGGTAFTSCVAFGLERWVSVLVAAYGSAPQALEAVRHAASALQPA